MEKPRICKNCGADFTHEYTALVKEIENLKKRLETLEEQKTLMENGFCGSYCEFRYHEG